jgi:hydroxyacyl-ACP dehydratase HTD2-like protein with hotdog domain
MSNLLTDEALAWIGRADPPVSVVVSRRDIVKYAISTEQTQKKYLHGDEAPPMFVAGLAREVVPLGELGLDGLAQASLVPELPLKRVMAGGVEFDFYRTVHAGDVLVFDRSLSALTEKQGRTGPLIFVTYTIACRTEAGEPVLDQKQTRILR